MTNNGNGHHFNCFVELLPVQLLCHMFTLSTILIFDIGTVPTAWYCFSFYVSTFIGTVPTAWYCFSFYVSTFIGTVPTAWYCFSFYVSTFCIFHGYFVYQDLLFCQFVFLISIISLSSKTRYWDIWGMLQILGQRWEDCIK